MKLFTKFFLSLVALFATLTVSAQESSFNTTMRSNGRIYVVVAVVITILIGLFLYLYRLERKISKLEKEG